MTATREARMCYPSRMRLIFLALTSLSLLAACGPDPVDTTTDATATASTGASMTGTTGTTGTGSTAGTDAPTTGTTSTTDPTATGTTVTTATTVETSTSGTTTDPGTSGGPGSAATTDSTDTGPVGEVCEKDADCMLADDCCDCDGVPVGADVSVCDAECKQSKCSELGITKAVCRLGVCQTERLSCDASKVACDSLPPPCEPGTVAETTPACWSGKCVPAKNCDVLAACELCPEGRVCVQNVAFGPEPGVVCEPLTPGCDPADPCACIGDQVCIQPFGACFNQPGGDITCECINC